MPHGGKNGLIVLSPKPLAGCFSLESLCKYAGWSEEGMLVLRAITVECSILANGEVKVSLGRSCSQRVQSRAPVPARTSTCSVAMAHRRSVWISVAEMKLYYIYSEWCSWLHSLAEGESWGPLRKGALCSLGALWLVFC